MKHDTIKIQNTKVDTDYKWEHDIAITTKWKIISTQLDIKGIFHGQQLYFGLTWNRYLAADTGNFVPRISSISLVIGSDRNWHRDKWRQSTCDGTLDSLSVGTKIYKSHYKMSEIY